MWSLLEWLQDGGLELSEDILTLMASGSCGLSPGTPVGTVVLCIEGWLPHNM